MANGIPSPPRIGMEPPSSSRGGRQRLTPQQVQYINAGMHKTPLTSQQVKYINAGTGKTPLTPQQVQYINAGTQGQSAPPNTPSPYDAQYFNDLAISNQNAGNRIANYQYRIDTGATNLQNAISQLQYNNKIADANAQKSENARGGFAQGNLGYQIGQLNHGYVTQEGNLFTRYAQDKGALDQAIAQTRQGLPLATIALGLASAARQANLGYSAQTPTAQAPAPPAPPKISGQPRGHGGHRGRGRRR